MKKTEIIQKLSRMFEDNKLLMETAVIHEKNIEKRRIIAKMNDVFVYRTGGSTFYTCAFTKKNSDPEKEKIIKKYCRFIRILNPNSKQKGYLIQEINKTKFKIKKVV